MPHQISRPTTKKRTNVTISAGLLSEARENGINLSALLEAALQQTLKQSRQQRYLQKNQAAITAHNAFIEKAGLFSDDEGVI